MGMRKTSGPDGVSMVSATTVRSTGGGADHDHLGIAEVLPPPAGLPTGVALDVVIPVELLAQVARPPELRVQQ